VMNQNPWRSIMRIR